MRAQVLRAVLGITVALLLLEVLARLGAPGDVHLPIHTTGGGAGIQLAAGVSTVGRLPDGARYDVRIDAHGLREPTPTAPAVLLLGDSGAFGVGVHDGQTLAAHLTARGHPTANAGIPAFNVADALAHGTPLAELLGVQQVVVLVNPADDHLVERAHERFAVAGRWLVSRSTPRALRTLLDSPLGRSRLFIQTLSRLNAFRMERPTAPWHTHTDGGRAAFARVGASIAAFASKHPTCAVWMPYDAVLAPSRPHPSPHAGAPVDDTAALLGIREGLAGVPLVVPRPTDPATWLPGDVHLSDRGYRDLAREVAGCLSASARRPTADPGSPGGPG